MAAHNHFESLPMDSLLKAACNILPATGYDLDNDIHPILARPNFPGLKETDYEALTPGLRVLSHILSTDCLLRIWHVILRGKERKVRNANSKGTHVAYFPLRPKMSPLDVQLAKLDLLNLAKVAQFYPVEQDGRHNGETRHYAGIHLRTQTVDTSGKLTSSFSGNPSIIEYSQELHDSICSSYWKVQSSSRKKFEIDMRAEYFVLVNLLLHEIAHAADIARYGFKPFDTPIECSLIAETGVDCTATIFGGICNWNEPRALMYREDWPSPISRSGYLGDESTMWCDGNPDGIVTTRWRIPDAWTQQLFLKAFWDQIVPVDGADAPKVPRLLGARFVRHECKCVVCKEVLLEKDRYMERPDVPGCRAGDQDMGVPAAKGGRDMIGVPTGYILYKDGTLVKAELRRLVKKLERASWPPVNVMLVDGTVVGESLQEAFEQGPKGARASKAAAPKKASKTKLKTKKKRRS
ncbi:hypothetical protein LTR85_002815 [Meristemomyces frigidus]|nr:hypothetical protein LTR85_002815 [Meristemomyces frigidus]